MAVLHRLRHESTRGGLTAPFLAMGRSHRLVLNVYSVLLFLSCSLALSACREREAPNQNPPDSLLQDSLGLMPTDQVHRIVLSSRNGAETVEPTEVTLRPGQYVEFFTEDRHVRTVAFITDSLNAQQTDFLRSSAQDRSPPLVELESRFLVSFVGAPPGRYPFVVTGNERSIQGVVVVANGEQGR